MKSRSVLCALLFSLGPAPLVGQGAHPEARTAVSIGFGNHYGWLGASGEAYFVPGRFSVFAGIGFMPDALFDAPTSVAGAAGVRSYASLHGPRHRVFADLSISLLQVSDPALVGAPITHDYGPGVSIGYSYLAESGFTLMAGAGGGLANDGIVPVLQVGLGWTWRH